MFSSFDQGLKFFIENEVVAFYSGKPFTLEVASTSKLIKLFHLTPSSERNQNGSGATDYLGQASGIT